MANQASKLLTFIVETFDTMPLVNTIVFKDDDVLDVEKENVYPLVSIQLLTSPAPLLDLREFRLAFEILNQRDDTKKPTPSKLLSDVNYIDNIGICDSIANNFIMEILKTHNDLSITIVDDSISDFEMIRRDERNCLDGIKFECTFSMHQNGI
jgi:hypothetical protein